MGKKLMLLFLIFALAGFFQTGFAAEEEIPFFEYRPATTGEIEAFIYEAKHAKNAQIEKLTQKYEGRTKKVAKHQTVIAFNKIIDDADRVLQNVRQNGIDTATEREFMKIQRLYYGTIADIGGAEKKSKFSRGARFVGNLALGPIRLKVPDIICPELKTGKKQAGLEAKNLAKPGKKGVYTAEELARLSAYEISRLEPVENHAAYTGNKPGDYYAKFLDHTREQIRKLDKDYQRFDYSFARRVLFFDELKEDATSPKITTKDRYGLKWKLKWGDEVHSDVAMTRLYIDLGGRYTDLKFYSGPGESILVLDKPGKKNAVTTFDQMASLLLNSKFEFHAYRYLLPEPVIKDKTGKVLGSGIVDATMAEREGIPEDRIGCYYVLFKECQLSLYNPAIKRLGGAALSNVGAVEDRVARSSLVFNAWVKNKDMKDDNSRVGLLFNPQTGSFDQHVEFQSDLGCTLGGLRTSGDLNRFEKKMIMLMPQSINFFMRPLYIPQAWENCTWADARWMAMRIATLKRADLERAFADSGWPAFVQKVAIEKLINRRNELVKAFRLEEDGFKMLDCNPEFNFTVKGKGGAVDYPVKRGVINKNSATVKMLENQYHPEGLAKVVSRKED